MNSSRGKRRVLPLTTRCAAALNVSWGTCPYELVRTKIIYIYTLGIDYRRDGESERRVRNRSRGRRLRAMDEDDCTTSVECGPYGIESIIADVFYSTVADEMGPLNGADEKRTSFTSVPVRRRNGHTHRTKLVKNIGDEFKSP